MTEAALLLLASAISILAPDVLQGHYGGTEAAWDYVCHGAAVCLLWVVAARTALGKPLVIRVAILVAAAYGLWESVQRPICRLGHPMTRAPNLPDGVQLCDALGWGSAQWSSVLISCVAVVVAFAYDYTRGATHERAQP